MKQIFISIGVLLLSVGFCFAQPRPIPTEKPKVSVAPAPPMFAVKYEGGMFGYSKKEPGTVKFDDENERLVFSGEDQKEKFQIPYRSILLIYPQAKSVNTTAGTVVGAVAGDALPIKQS